MSWDDATILIGGIATLAIYSFLIKENAFYRFFEHLFIGIAAGFLPILTIKNFLWPKVIEPMIYGGKTVYPDGFIVEPFNYYYLLYGLPLLFGLLYYFIYSDKYSWLAKLVIGFSLGFSAGLSFKGFFNEILPQLSSSFKPLVVFDQAGSFDPYQSISNALFVVILLSVMSYFFFSFKKFATINSKISVFSRWFMMVCFGAFFGSTVMARMALLVERVQFLVENWFVTIIKVI
jgi:hypothetical protein